MYIITIFSLLTWLTRKKTFPLFELHFFFNTRVIKIKITVNLWFHKICKWKWGDETCCRIFSHKLTENSLAEIRNIFILNFQWVECRLFMIKDGFSFIVNKYLWIKLRNGLSTDTNHFYFHDIGQFLFIL